MADVEIFLDWAGEGLRFAGRGRSPVGLVLDGDSEHGPSPVEALLLSAAACMAADLIDIGRKMRLPIRAVEVHGTGDRRADPPRRYTNARLTFTVAGVADEDEPKLRRALDLSAETYCSVIHTLRPDLEVELELVRTSVANTASERDE